MTPRGPWGAPLSLEVILRPMAFIRSTDGLLTPPGSMVTAGDIVIVDQERALPPEAKGAVSLQRGAGFVCA